MVAPPMELKAVLVKLSVELPPAPLSSPPTRLRMALLGALKFTSTSPTQVWLIVILTLISVMVALAGIPAMVRFEVAATPVPSGIGTLIVPEFALACPGTGGAAVAALVFAVLAVGASSVWAGWEHACNTSPAINIITLIGNTVGFKRLLLVDIADS